MFESKAQARFAYANPEKFGGEKGLKEWSDATDFKNLPEKAPKHKMQHVIEGLSHKPKAPKKYEDKRSHGFHHTHIEHHSDGSHTVRHSGPAVEDAAHAVQDLDGVHDSLQAHLANPISEQESQGPSVGGQE